MRNTHHGADDVVGLIAGHHAVDDACGRTKIVGQLADLRVAFGMREHERVWMRFLERTHLIRREVLMNRAVAHH